MSATFTWRIKLLVNLSQEFLSHVFGPRFKSNQTDVTLDSYGTSMQISNITMM